MKGEAPKDILTIDIMGYDLVARTISGNVVLRRKTKCNPEALAQIICDAEQIGKIDWAASQVTPSSGQRADWQLSH
jgi:hypothetical protein